MKKLLFLFLTFAALSCTAEDADTLNDCEARKAEINAQYDAQVEWVTENTNPIDVRQIQLINNERVEALNNACE